MNQSDAGLYRGNSEEFWTDERCFIRELLNTQASAEVSVAAARVLPGVTTQLHALSVCERYLVQQGNGLMELHGQQPFTIGPGDCVLIPQGVSQRVRNTGVTDLIFLCICSPRFEPHHYVDLETVDTPELDLHV